MEVILSADPDYRDIFNAFHKEYSYTPLFSTLYTEHAKAYYHATEFEDLSFIVTNNNAPIALFFASAQMDREPPLLGAYGMPAFYFEIESLDAAEKKQLKKIIRAQLDRIFAEKNITSLSYFDSLEDGVLSEAGKYFQEAGAVPKPYFTQILSLTENEESLKQGLRKSYKSLINWGKNNLEVKVYTRSNITYEIFDQLRLLHLEVSGRETRNLKSWDVQYEQIINDEAFLVLGNLESELVTGSLFLYNKNNCYYGVSASKRELFEKPISHIILWTGILFAQSLNCNSFEMGEMLYPYHLENNLRTQKELDISKFKRGFGGKPRVYLHISK